MVTKRGLIERERIAGAVIFVSLFVILLSMVGIRFLDVRVSNIELIGSGLYTITTDYGPINVSQDDIIRIERTYPKAAITGAVVEQDKVFTTKGFIFISKLDPFFKTGQQLINSVDFKGIPVWIPTNDSEETGSVETQMQSQNANLRAVQPFSYAIGTPSKFTPIVFAVLFIQYLALAIGGIALLILIFPLRWGTLKHARSSVQQDPEYRSTEESVGAGAVAK